ncbi:hypothetical protein [Helicobacter sp.]|uniref:bacteriophage T4 gp5 trimerisation domain-containing protein n=1 Tax=Helicobacter sp. TaxID=218 RepID=UPI0037503B88
MYNTTNPIPSTLPKQDHITTLSSKTIGAQEYGYNQLCFSNLKDNEEISLKAQKDYRESINNNFSQTIHNNKSALNLLKIILESLMSFIKSWSKNLMKK